MELLIALLISFGAISAEESKTMSKDDLDRQAKVIGLEEDNM